MATTLETLMSVKATLEALEIDTSTIEEQIDDAISELQYGDLLNVNNLGYSSMDVSLYLAQNVPNPKLSGKALVAVNADVEVIIDTDIFPNHSVVMFKKKS